MGIVSRATPSAAIRSAQLDGLKLALEAISLCLDRLLADYSASTGWRLDDAYRVYHGHTCLKIPKQLATGRGPHPRPTGGERERQVRQILKAGSA